MTDWQSPDDMRGSAVPAEAAPTVDLLERKLGLTRVDGAPEARRDRPVRGVWLLEPDLLPLLLRVRAAGAQEERTRQVLAAARLAILQLLMGGELPLARRTAAAVDPGLLDADLGRVLILRGRPEDRDAVVRECYRAIGNGALVVRCPVYDTNVNIVVPVPARAGVPDRWDAISADLIGIVAARTDRYLGGSHTAPLSATAQSYRDASRALAVARQLDERVALHGTETAVAQLLDHRARGWAEALLAPVLALERTEREQILDTLPLVLEFGVTGAARLIDRHRNTVSALRKRAAHLLELDLGDVMDRSRLDLALQLLARTPPGPGGVGSVQLSDLLATPPVRAWAQRWLEGMDGDGRDLRRTLLCWVEENTRVDRAATRLRLYPDTVREHLKTADRLLHRDLMSPSGPHDLVLALLADGALRPAEPLD